MSLLRHISLQRYNFFFILASSTPFFTYLLPFTGSQRVINGLFRHPSCPLLAPYFHRKLIGSSSEAHRNLAVVWPYLLAITISFCRGYACEQKLDFLCSQFLLNAKSVWQNFINPWQDARIDRWCDSCSSCSLCSSRRRGSTRSY